MHWKMTAKISDWKRKEEPNLQSDGEHQHGENNRPKGPIPKNLKNTLHCHRRLGPSPWRGTETTMRTGVQAGTRGEGWDGATATGDWCSERRRAPRTTRRPLCYPAPCSATQTDDPELGQWQVQPPTNSNVDRGYKSLDHLYFMISW